MAERHSVWGEGTDVGLLGGVAVAVFFLILDILAGHPLRTPSVLGQVVLFGEGRPDIMHIDFGAVLLYTVVHFALFALFGVLLVKVIHMATDNPVVRFAVLIVFVAFELFFYGVVAMLSATTRDLFPFWRVLAANTIAALVMGTYLWRSHPALRQALYATPLGDMGDRD
ncbi:MAG TPA: hypothetical protein VFS40_13620 [Gemmatimonadales bacterium]|nr:hypothetical protein [Gemmatimonadales bacterium]